MDNPKPGTCDYKILIVENEPGIRQVFLRILQFLGYSVITAQNGKQGLNLLQKDNTINLVITDINMPIMDGQEFLSRIQKTHPNLKKIVVSGSTFTPRNLPANIILQKPIGMKELSLAVSNCQ